MIIQTMPYPAAVAATDPHFASVVLLLSASGADDSTSFVDESPVGRTLTSNVGAKVDTGVTLFGAPSIELTSSGYVSAADSADWAFGTGDFTVEAWVYWGSAPAATKGILGQYNGALGTECSIDFQWNTTNGLRYRHWSGSFVAAAGAWSPSGSAWHHVAADRASGVLRVYANGAMLGKNASASGSVSNSSQNLRVGAVAGVATMGADGRMNEVRITKGVARYASDSGYTVPTAAFPRS